MSLRSGFCIGCVFLSVLAVGCRRGNLSQGTSGSNGTPLKILPIANGPNHKVLPKYPAVAKAAHVEGTVTLHAIIATDGTVESLEVIDGPPLLQGAAIDAVKQWVYTPYMLNGVPRRVSTTVTVNFQLTRS